MERDFKKYRRCYSGNGTPELPFIPVGSPDILSFSLELAKGNLEPISKGKKIYATFNWYTFAIEGHPENGYLPNRVEVSYVEPGRESVPLRNTGMIVRYSQRLYSSFLMEILKKELGI